MTARMLGIETEYAISATDSRGVRVEQGQVLDALMRNARRTLPHLPDELGRGMFLAGGGRFYVDCGGHPEVTTPECGTPWELVHHVRAGERMLLQLANGWGGRRASGRLVIFRSNVDYADGSRATWGTHENLSHRIARHALPPQIVPHLVSRLVFTGAGGFDNVTGGIDFTLSPRVPHLTKEISADSTANRGIFHQKGEDLCTGFHRLHILCGESLCSDLALWLRAGTTALVLALCEAGLRPGDAVALRDPVAAMHRFAADPSCRAEVETKRGGRVTAIAVQRHYLTLAEAHLDAPFMPSWAADVCREWRAILERLESGWEGVATRLDWAIKLGLYRSHAERRGVPWTALAAWSPVVAALSTALARTGRRDSALISAVVLGTPSPVAAEVTRQTPIVTAMGRSWKELGTILDLRHELFEIDTRFGQIGERGIFERLAAAGVLQHRVDVPAPAGDDASTIPRARRRGELVRELTGQGTRYTCSWQGVWDGADGTFLDLSDPFAAPTEWKKWSFGEDPMPPPRFVSACEPTIAASEARARQTARATSATPDPIALNNRALALRKQDRLEEAERLLREAIAIEDTQVPIDSPKRPHRRNNLALVLLRAGKRDEAEVTNLEAWLLKSGRHDVTSGRILFARTALRLLAGGGVRTYLGQLKTLFATGPLACLGDVTAEWDVSDVLDTLRDDLPAADAALLSDLAEVLNDPLHAATLGAHAAWVAATPVALAQSWSGNIDPTGAAA